MFIKRPQKNNKQKGFTLIEMLVSVALFSVVLTVMMGTIVTIADTNKKARSLMSVMNNLNFTVDSMTRSFKTGTGMAVTGDHKSASTSQINYNDSTDFATQNVIYEFKEVGDLGKITKTVAGTTMDLTSPDIDIDDASFYVYTTSGGTQPRLRIILDGTVQISPRVKSNFSIQTTVEQRQLVLEP